ncbi:hypothetical protein FDC27_05085 [Clostridium botulinum]|nr:hypothetical protein [Clostridium botulinum]NFO66351.1 hypothetical protein [Clostridium botulinum]
MIFNDYVVNLNLQINELEKLEMIKKQLKNILELHEEWVEKTFSYTYGQTIRSTVNSNYTSKCNELVDYTDSYFLILRENLICIDFMEFGEILSNFKRLGLDLLKDNTDEIVLEYKGIYKCIHLYRSYLNKADRIKGYTEFINSIRRMLDIYDEFVYMLTYINKINENLGYGSEDEEETLEIRLLNDSFKKETYIEVTDPVYKLYEKISEIANIDIKEEQLRIVRMETGSFFIKFIGNKSILKLIASIIESVHKVFISNYTKDGQKQNLVESTELFKSHFNIIKEMKELGIDVSEQENIANETLVLLMKQANILLSSSPDVRINKKVLSKSEDIKKALECNNYKTISSNENVG